jgi:hypothetical protein
VPPPKCTFAQVWAAAVGSRPDVERALLTYSARTEEELGGPVFTIEVPGVGRARVDGETCALLPRERLRPPAVAVSALPGSPKPLDPLELVAVARKQSGLDDDAVLLDVAAKEVGAKGRVDLGSGGSIVYVFSDPASVPAQQRRWRQVEIRAGGVTTTGDETKGTLPPQYDVALPPPTCSFAAAHAYVMLGRSGAAATVQRISYAKEPGSHEGRWTIELGTSDARVAITDAECSSWAAANPVK